MFVKVDQFLSVAVDPTGEVLTSAGDRGCRGRDRHCDRIACRRLILTPIADHIVQFWGV